MADIIQDAKKLLDDATPGPWVISGEFDPECPELQGAPQLENGLLKVPIISHDIYGDFFPEDGDLIAKSWTNAKALAEEEYQYGVTYIGVNHGGHHIEWVENTGDAEWDKDTLQLLVKRWKRKGQSPKIVRRRVSKPEEMKP